MTLMLDVPPVLEATLQANAQARGVTLEQYIIALMERETFVLPPAWLGELDVAGCAGLRRAAAR